MDFTSLPHFFSPHFLFFLQVTLSSQLEQATAASRPGSWTRGCLRPLGPPPAGPRFPGVNCSRFWFAGRVRGARGGQCWAALCSQAALMPSPRKKRKRGSDRATSSPHWVSDTIVITRGGFLGALVPRFTEGSMPAPRPMGSPRVTLHVAQSRPLSLSEKQHSPRSGHEAQGQPFLSGFCLGEGGVATGTSGSA